MNNITGLPKPEANDLRKALEKAKRQLPEMVEVAQIVARETFAKFEALTKAGFTQEQAMRLLCAERIKIQA